MLKYLSENKLLFSFCLMLVLVVFGWNQVLELRAEEPRRAIVTMEMLMRGEFWVPEINGWSYYNKPPVFNWWMAVFLTLFGSFEEWAIRFPALLAYILLAITNYFLLKKYLGKQVALFSSLFFLTAADLLFYGTVNAGEIDLFFSYLVYLQVLCIFLFFERKQFLFLFLGSYFFAALGTLTKGPPSIAFQALTLLPWLIFNRKGQLLFHWKHFAGIFVFLFIVGGYFWYYDQLDDSIGYMVRLFKEASQRTGMEHELSATLKRSFVFPFYLFQVLAPWSLFFLFFLRQDFFTVIRSKAILSFCVIFILFNIPLYWFSGEHKARYLYMFFPFFTILFAYFFVNHSPGFAGWVKRIRQLFLGVMILLSLAFIAPPFIPECKDISFIELKSFLILVLGGLLVFLYQKMAANQILIFLLFMLVIRLGFNFTYLPATAKYSSRLIYRDHAQKVLAITKDQPVHWTGTPETYSSDASIGPLLIKQVELTTPPLLAYQIPYYITKANGHIMQFDTVLLADHYYLARQSFMPKDSTEVLYRFPDNWIGVDLVLFKSAR